MKLATLSLLFAGANAAALRKVGGKVIDGEYIVVMKEGASEASLDKASGSCYSKGLWKNIPGFRGFAARLSKDELNVMLANPDVEFVEPDSVVHAITEDACSDTQTARSSWGQSRTTRTSGYDTNAFDHEPSWGQGVKVYVIDTGTNCGHNDFAGAGNCSCGPTFSGGSDGCSDGNGHGTHCSSTATGAVWGIAKNAEAVGIKVLGDNGSGSTSGVISGMDWVASQGSGVASMSLGGGYSAASNNAVAGMSRAGVFVAVAAGNDGRDACNYSPASAPEAYTVGATDSSDRTSSFSNTGTCVDIFAPGSSITAASGSSGSGSAVFSGTSMACPHVAGAAAAILSENPSYSVAQIKTALTNLALEDVISNVGSGSPNLLLHLEC